MKKCLTVFGGELATVLINQGYKVQGVSQDRKYPDRVVYFFDNRPEVQQAIKAYSQDRSKLECTNYGRETNSK